MLQKFPWLADEGAGDRIAQKSGIHSLAEVLDSIAGVWLRSGVSAKATHSYYVGGKPKEGDTYADHIIADIKVEGTVITMDLYEDAGKPRMFEDAKAAGLKPIERLVINGRNWTLSTPEGTKLDGDQVAEYLTPSESSVARKLKCLANKPKVQAETLK